MTLILPSALTVAVKSAIVQGPAAGIPLTLFTKTSVNPPVAGFHSPY